MIFIKILAIGLDCWYSQIVNEDNTIERNPQSEPPEHDRQRAIFEGYVELTDDIRSQLKAEAKRTGLGTVLLLRQAENVPEGLTYLVAQSWITGDVMSAREYYLNFVIRAWAEQPDSEWIEITDEMREHMRSEAQRTGKAPSALFRGLRPSEIDGLNASIVKNWMSGGTTRAQKPKLDFVLERWRSLPSC